MRLNKSIILRVLFAIFLIASIVGLFVNKGLYHFELNTNSEARLAGDPQDISSFINGFSDSNLVRVDKINGLLFFENTNAGIIKPILDSANKDNKLIIEVSDNFYQRNEVIRTDILLVGTEIAATLGLFIYFLLKNKKALQFKQGMFVVLTYLELAFFSNLILAGLVSLISRYYQIRVLDLTTFLFMNLWLSIIFFTAIHRLDPERFESISSLFATEDFYHRRYLIILFVVLALATLGLGLNFVVTALLIFAGVVLVSFVYSNLGSLPILNFDIPRPSLNFRRPSLPGIKQNKPTAKPQPKQRTGSVKKNKNKKRKN